MLPLLLSYPDALALYLLCNIALWAHRCSPSSGLAYNNGLMLDNIARWRIRYKADQPDALVTFDNTAFPPWWGDARVHDSDKAILYRKDHTAYAHFKRYAVQYEQYVWPYQIEEEARRRQRLAAGVEADGRESEGDEEAEGFEAPVDEAKDDSGAKRTAKGAQKAKRARAVKGGAKEKSRAKRKLESAVVELDDDDEQVDATVVAAMHSEHEANGRGSTAVHELHNEKKQRKRAAKHKVSARAARKTAIETTEEVEVMDVAAAAKEDDNVVQAEPQAGGRGGKARVKQRHVKGEHGDSNEVSAEARQHGKPKKRQKVNQEAAAAVADGSIVERRRSGRRTSVVT